MNKEQLIERHGIEWYEQFKLQSSNRIMEHYHNDPKYRKRVINRCSEYNKERSRNDPEFMKSKRARSAARVKERYNNDPEYHNYMNKLSRARKQARYVENRRIDLIENYELAAQDNFKGWDIHHRLELHPDGSVRFMKENLIKHDLYNNRPPSELIWLRCSEHRQMHGKTKNLK